jgi:DNA-binding NarL/FixJ family response regulator
MSQQLAPRARPIRVAMVDDHHMILEGLRLVLATAPSVEVVGDASSQAEAFDLVAATNPDVLLLDLTFPEGDGLPLLQELLARYPDLRIVVLTVLRGPETVRQAMLAGAAGYVIKGAYSRDLVDAIHAVARGERYLHSSVTAAIVDDSIRWQREGEPVSVREREVLSLLAEGKSTQAVSETLGISAHTVRRHVANLSAKLGVRGGAALTLYAIQHGFVRDR